MASGVRLALAVVLAAGVTACSSEDETDIGRSGAEAAALRAEPLDWRNGANDTKIYLSGDDEIVRCWNLKNQYDCIYANEFDIRAEMADAPVRRSFFRFITPRLLATAKDLKDVAVSDGYQCDVNQVLGETVQTESLWRNGNVGQSHTVSRARDGEPWDQERVSSAYPDNRQEVYRPYFLCMGINEVVQNAGLTAIDSPLVSYERVVAVDRDPISAAAPTLTSEPASD